MTESNRTIYIHYGNTEYNKYISNPISNLWPFPMTKPHGGFWGSPVNAKYGWKDWCKDEDYRTCDEADSFKFVMRNERLVAKINSLEKLYLLPRLPDSGFSLNIFDRHYIDFEKCLELGLDAIEVSISDDPRLQEALYGWDCDSILVLNPEAVIQIYSQDLQPL